MARHNQWDKPSIQWHLVHFGMKVQKTHGICHENNNNLESTEPHKHVKSLFSISETILHDLMQSTLYRNLCACQINPQRKCARCVQPRTLTQQWIAWFENDGHWSIEANKNIYTLTWRKLSDKLTRDSSRWRWRYFAPVAMDFQRRKFHIRNELEKNVSLNTQYVRNDFDGTILSDGLLIESSDSFARVYFGEYFLHANRASHSLHSGWMCGAFIRTRCGNSNES